MAPRIFTIGHSTRSIDDFVALLRAHGVKLLADVRQFPASRRLPHFNKDPLAAALAETGIAYEHLVDLGGRRKPRKDSRNTAWRNDAFRGYADYMETPPFQAALARLESLAPERPTAIMCAEALWWSCHRSLIADALKARGWDVRHIESTAEPKEHPWTSAATFENGELSYQSPDVPGLFNPT
jgi:uncharacterized protein (DUF488 family)